nr:MAG TPA: hypothetical protein [Caudoviricetes sp.]
MSSALRRFWSYLCVRFLTASSMIMPILLLECLILVLIATLMSSVMAPDEAYDFLGHMMNDFIEGTKND